MSTYKKPASLIPGNEEERLSKLYSYGILDTLPEEAFDKIARLAAEIFKTQSSYIGFVDRDRVFFKSNHSPLKLDNIPRKDCLCSLAILNLEEMTIINDTSEHEELKHHPLVEKESVRFYAGAPIKTPEGYQIGVICVADTMPRPAATIQEYELLKILSGIISDELENRNATRKIAAVQTDLMNMMVHNLKNPLTSISLYVQFLKDVAPQPEAEMMIDKISGAARQILTTLNSFTDLSKIESGYVSLMKKPTGICPILEKVKQDFEAQAAEKKQQIKLALECSSKTLADEQRLTDIFTHLVSNAIKFSHANTVITISTTESEEYITVEVKDEGQGLTPQDLEKLFSKFPHLSSVPTGGERSTGLGLSIVKTLVELHKGKVWATSGGKGKGTSFYVQLKRLKE